MPGSFMLWRAGGARRSLPPGQEGFLLPMSMLVALLLMLSSLMLLTLALQSRLQAAVQRQRRQTEDELMSAAQHWAGHVQRHCPEALVGGSPCKGIEADEAYRLVSYVPGGGSLEESPAVGTGELVLELSGEAAPPNGARGAFALRWRRELLPAGEGETEGEEESKEEVLGLPHLVGLEERGLREVAP